MIWLRIIFVICIAVIVARLYLSLRKLRADQVVDWDSKLIERLRKQGADPFKPQEVDWFFALPTEAACEQVRRVLESEGFSVDVKPSPDSVSLPFSLHAANSIRLNAPDMRAMTQRFNQLAEAHGGRYDGWNATPGEGAGESAVFAPRSQRRTIR